MPLSSSIRMEVGHHELSGGLVFLVAISQGFLVAGLLFGPGEWMLRFGIVLNASMALAWIVTGFVGAPTLLGFARLQVEPLNLVAFAAEIALLVLLFGIARNSAVRREAEPCSHPAQRD